MTDVVILTLKRFTAMLRLKGSQEASPCRPSTSYSAPASPRSSRSTPLTKTN